MLFCDVFRRRPSKEMVLRPLLRRIVVGLLLPAAFSQCIQLHTSPDILDFVRFGAARLRPCFLLGRLVLIRCCPAAVHGNL